MISLQLLERLLGKRFFRNYRGLWRESKGRYGKEREEKEEEEEGEEEEEERR